MKASPGTGIVSSIVLESDDLDEIDWEFLGGSNNQVQSDFFGKGNTTSYDRAQYHDISDTQGTWHTYSVDWTSERLEWLIDGTVVRTMPYSSSLTLNGQNYPQTPMRLKLGNWCGGCSSAEGTVTWAGGVTTFGSDPYNMYVKSVSITNANPACSYEYSDMTGSYESITVNTSGCSVQGGSSSSSSASSSGSSSVAPSGSATGSVSSSATVAPTSSHVVAPISEQTGVVASTTITGSAYSTNSAAISSLNAGNTLVTVTGTGSSSQQSGVNATGSSGKSPTASGPTASSTVQTGAASSMKSFAAAGSLVALAFAFFL